MSSAQQCVICYDELTAGLSAAPCGHVFHSVCIEQWIGPGRHCPICHARLPSKLLKLYYEPQKGSAEDAAVSGASAGACASADDASPTSASGAGDREPVSEEVTQLRRKLTSSNKYNERSKEAYLKQARELQDLRRQLNETQTEALVSKGEMEAEVVLATGKLETTRIDLFKKHKELNKLKREMEGTLQRLREFQGEKVAYGYLRQFSSPARGRALNGLGQVDVEKVIEQIRQGTTQAETVIRGQHEQLTGAIDREQRTKRELRKTMTGSETMALELQQAQSRLTKAKKDAWRLEKILAKATADNESKIEAQAAGRRRAALSLSPGAILGDWVAEERPRTKGGERTWALSRRSSNDGGAGVNKEFSTCARSSPTGAGGRSAAAAEGTSEGLARRRARPETEDDLVSLGSDDDGEEEEEEEEDEERTGGQNKRFKKAAKMWGLGPPRDMSTLLTPVASSRSFLTSAAAVAGGRAGAQQNGKRAKYISTGHNAVGGRHKVRLPFSSSSSSSSSSAFKNPFCLGGKQSRLGASSRH